MGLIDAKLALKSADLASEDITMNGTTEVFSDYIDSRKVLSTTLNDSRTGFANGPRKAFLNVRVKTVGTAANTTLRLADSLDNSTYATVAPFTQTIASGSIVANTVIWKIALPAGLRRYFKLGVVGAAAATSVLNAWISYD